MPRMQKRMGIRAWGNPGKLAGARGRWLAAMLGLAMLALLATASPAFATFHLIKVREIYAGANNDSYVELQMFAPGQNLLGGHSMTVYNASGALVHSSTFAGSVAKSANQQTVLIGDTGVQGAFGIAPDLVDPNLSIAAAGGAACWNAGGIPADCVAWGNFSGGAALQAATGTSAGSPASPAGITAGKAIRRTIAPGCPTLLEESDDSNNSAADFAEVAPAPRNNTSAITETTCAGAPNTAIDDKPALRSPSSSAEFTYDSPTATSYECSLDNVAFSPCPFGGPKEYTGLSDGSHTFRVRGVNASGPDPTPAGFTWSVDTVAPVTTIDTHPADPSRGDNAAFTFHAANEPGSTFKCALDGAIPATCASGITFHGLANGSHVFEVEATDAAGNVELSPALFSWTVDNTLPDETPPETTIKSMPANPSNSPTASFTYASNEPGSSFECALDDAVFSSCAPEGISYTGLANGPHSFQVRAVDAGENADPSPAGYSFDVVLPEAPVPAPAPPQPSTPSGAAPAPGPKLTLPQTKLTVKPPAKTHDRTPTFRFSASGGGATFQCKIDAKPFVACRSPLTTKSLTYGSHTLQVRAVAAGGSDPSPAKFHFKVTKP
jgi:hypothetical protein